MKRITFRAALLPALLLALLGGCATTPEEPAPAPEPQVAPAEPEPLVMKPDYPERYVVVRGDTLWDISERFLRDPWRWPELWQKNTYIANPHLIYPGDVLTLLYIDGQPTLQVQRGSIGRAAEGRPTVRLSPRVRVEDLDRAVPTIPLDAIRPFLARPRVVTEEELEAAPYFLASADDHLIAASGNRIFVRGIDDPNIADYAVVRQGDAYVNPEDEDDILGYEAIHIGDARVVRFGDPATLVLTKSNREALKGDRLLPGIDNVVNTHFIPKAPEQPVNGHIISVLDGVSQIGQFQVVVIDQGLREGLAAGDVLAVYQSGVIARDPIRNEEVVLPDQKAGTLMVFRTFERMAFALVMDATRPIHTLDRVTNP